MDTKHNFDKAIKRGVVIMTQFFDTGMAIDIIKRYAERTVRLNEFDLATLGKALRDVAVYDHVTAETVGQLLGEYIPGAYQISAKALGVTIAGLGPLLAGGKVKPKEFLMAFASTINEMEKSESNRAVTDRIILTQQQLQEALMAWDKLHRSGGTMTEGQTMSMSPEAVASAAADYLWGELSRIVGD